MTCAGCGQTEDVSVRTSPAPCVAASGPLIGSHSSQADLRSLSRAHGAVRRGGMSRQPVRGTSLWISNNKPQNGSFCGDIPRFSLPIGSHDCSLGICRPTSRMRRRVPYDLASSRVCDDDYTSPVDAVSSSHLLIPTCGFHDTPPAAAVS